MMARQPITPKNPYTPTRGVAASITFTSERQYRNALAQAKGFRSWREQQQRARTVRSVEDVATLRPSEQQARAKALDAVSRMRREGMSLSAAAKAAGTTVSAVKRYAAPALEKTSKGSYRAKPTDRLMRPVKMLTMNGSVTLDVRDSRSASRLGAYWHAVRTYLETGNAGPLRRFTGQSISVNKRKYFFVTDLDVLDAMADAGMLDFDDLYDLEAAA